MCNWMKFEYEINDKTIYNFNSRIAFLVIWSKRVFGISKPDWISPIFIFES